jgi:hypothetical protein
VLSIPKGRGCIASRRQRLPVALRHQLGSTRVLSGPSACAFAPVTSAWAVSRTHSAASSRSCTAWLSARAFSCASASTSLRHRYTCPREARRLCPPVAGAVLRRLRGGAERAHLRDSDHCRPGSRCAAGRRGRRTSGPPGSWQAHIVAHSGVFTEMNRAVGRCTHRRDPF